MNNDESIFSQSKIISFEKKKQSKELSVTMGYGHHIDMRFSHACTTPILK